MNITFQDNISRYGEVYTISVYGHGWAIRVHGTDGTDFFAQDDEAREWFGAWEESGMSGVVAMLSLVGLLGPQEGV